MGASRVLEAEGKIAFACRCGHRQHIVVVNGAGDADFVCTSCGEIVEPDLAITIAERIIRTAQASRERDIRPQGLHGELHAPVARDPE